MEKQKNWLVLCLTAGFLLVFALWSICKACLLYTSDAADEL